MFFIKNAKKEKLTLFYCFILGMVLLLGCFHLPVRGQNIGKWETLELSFTAGGSYPNPFVDVSMQVTFTSPGSRTVKRDAFYDGNGVWRVRLLADETGAWTYSTLSAPVDAGLSGKSGSFNCTASAKHGPPVVDPANRNYFKYKDSDQHMLYNGWTEFFGLASSYSESSLHSLADYLAANKISHVLMCIPFTKAQGWVVPAPAWHYPWEGAGSASSVNYDKFDLARCRRLDRIVKYFSDKGVAPYLWFYVDDEPALNGNIGAGSAREQRYFRYMVARLGAYENIIWNLALEYNEYRSSSWPDQMGPIVQQYDPWHMVTIHATPTGTPPKINSSWLDYGVIQNKTGAGALNGIAVNNFNKYGKPVVIDEIGYEGNQNSAANVLDALWAVFLGGAGFTNGFYKSGQTVTFPPAYSQTLPYQKHAVTFFEKTRFWLASPNNGLIKSGSGWCLAKAGSEYLLYLPSGGAVGVDLSAASGPLTVQWMDPKTGAFSNGSGVSGGAVRTLTPPFSEEAALLIRALDTSTADRTPPGLLFASASNDPAKVTVRFDEPVDQTTAETASNYAINNGISVSAASLESDMMTVTLSVSALSEAVAYTLTVNNVKDTAGNVIAVNSEARFSYSEHTGNRAPAALSDSAVTAAATPVYTQLNYDDPDQGPGPYAFEITVQPAHGSISGSANDQVYTPDPGFMGVDSFLWRVYDGKDWSDTAVWIIVVSGPVIEERTFKFPRDTYFRASPNPFNPAVRLEAGLSCESFTELLIFDARGALVKTLARGTLKAGIHAYTWYARRLPSGLYFARFRTGRKLRMIRLFLLK